MSLLSQARGKRHVGHQQRVDSARKGVTLPTEHQQHTPTAKSWHDVRGSKRLQSLSVAAFPHAQRTRALSHEHVCASMIQSSYFVAACLPPFSASSCSSVNGTSTESAVISSAFRFSAPFSAITVVCEIKLEGACAKKTKGYYLSKKTKKKKGVHKVHLYICKMFETETRGAPVKLCVKLCVLSITKTLSA